MIKKVSVKIIEMLIILIVISFLVFALIDIAPGDPAERKLTSQGIAVTRQVLEAEREKMGLTEPFYERYAKWLIAALHGDFGSSYKDGRPVAPKLFEGLKNTLALSVTAILLSLSLSFFLGMVSAVYKNTAVDHIIRVLSFVSNSLPNFLLAVLLIYFFSVKLKLLPVIARGNNEGMLLPVLALSIPMTGRFIRQMRTEFLVQLSEDYVMAMKMRGIKTGYILKNVIHNSLGHIFNIVSLQAGTLMAGSVVIETIFRWPGIGKTVMDSITARDYPVIMGFVIIMGTMYVFLNRLSDIINNVINPKISTS